MLEIWHFFQQKEKKNHLIINIESKGGEGRGELAWCPNSFLCNCLKEDLKNVTPLTLTKVGEEGSCTVSRVQLTSAAKKKQHAIASLTWEGTKKRKAICLNYLFR